MAARRRSGQAPPRPGTYAVGLECWKVPGRHDVPGVSLVPEGFKPPALVVPAEARSVTYSVDVK